MIKIIHGIIFDVDETLVYYEGYNQEEWYRLYVEPALLEQGIELDYSIYRKMTKGELPRSYVEGYGIDHVKFWKLVDNLSLKYRKELSKQSKIKAFPDVHVLEDIKDLGLKLAAVSNASQECTEFVLKLFDLRKYFDVVFGKDYGYLDGVKPNPHLIQKALRYLRLEPEETLVVGDSALDIMAGHRAGVEVVQILRFGKIDGADYYVENLWELLNLIKKIQGERVQSP